MQNMRLWYKTHFWYGVKIFFGFLIFLDEKCNSLAITLLYFSWFIPRECENVLRLSAIKLL